MKYNDKIRTILNIICTILSAIGAYFANNPIQN